MLKCNNKDTRATLLTSFFCLFWLTLNRFHLLFYYFHCWLWTSRCWMGFLLLLNWSPNQPNRIVLGTLSSTNQQHRNMQASQQNVGNTSPAAFPMVCWLDKFDLMLLISQHEKCSKSTIKTILALFKDQIKVAGKSGIQLFL